MNLKLIEGDLLEQNVEVIVNPWNRNIIPWWLLLPQGVSGAIKRRGGYKPFRELARIGVIPLGSAVVTSSGRLGYKAIIHVAGINLCWKSTEKSIRLSTRNAILKAKQKNFKSIAFPLIGAGTGGRSKSHVLNWMKEELNRVEFDGDVLIVRFWKQLTS